MVFTGVSGKHATRLGGENVSVQSQNLQVCMGLVMQMCFKQYEGTSFNYVEITV